MLLSTWYGQRRQHPQDEVKDLGRWQSSVVDRYLTPKSSIELRLTASRKLHLAPSSQCDTLLCGRQSPDIQCLSRDPPTGTASPGPEDGVPSRDARPPPWSSGLDFALGFCGPHTPRCSCRSFRDVDVTPAHNDWPAVPLRRVPPLEISNTIKKLATKLSPEFQHVVRGAIGSCLGVAKLSHSTQSASPLFCCLSLSFQLAHLISSSLISPTHLNALICWH